MERTASLHEQTQAPTAALDRIRKRWDTEHSLTTAQWELLAEYIEIGMEEEQQVPPLLQPAVPSRNSYLAVLEAFEAVYSHRRSPNSRQTWFYFSKLGGIETIGAMSSDAKEREDELLVLIEEQRRRLYPETKLEPPGQIGRCLRLAIRDEGVESTTLNRLLVPHWHALWGLAARGHWIRHGRQPVRAQPIEEDLRHGLDLPSPLTTGDVRLSFARSIGPEFATSIDFGPRRFSVLITRYPELIEFHTMLETATEQTWSGRYFQVSGAATPEGERTLWLRQHDVHINFAPAEWRQLRELFREAWTKPQLQWRVQSLRQEYGEHGEAATALTSASTPLLDHQS